MCKRALPDEGNKRRKSEFAFDEARMTRYNAAFLGQLAQLVEQRIENPRVRGSIPRLATRTQVESPFFGVGFLLI